LKITNDQVEVLSEGMPHLPEAIEELLFDSLNTENMSFIQHQVTLKQAFYNALLLTCMMCKSGEDENDFLEEFRRTMCYNDLMDRIKKGLLPSLA
jgi:two-component SAPR family response regulator